VIGACASGRASYALPEAHPVRIIETRLRGLCPRCMIDWPDGEDASCTEADHQAEHLTYPLHRHRSAVLLPDGTAITPVSFYGGDPYRRDEAPDYGLYLDLRWRPPWPHQHLDWPDNDIPSDQEEMLSGIGALLERARAGQRVEIGCLAGHGRTGTALATLVVLCGHPTNQAVAWVRANYCDRAVNAKQEGFVLRLSEP
jgi:hypothetical protein